MTRVRILILAGALALVAVPASAHVERSGYWPDPAPDCSIDPCAGGAVPRARSLRSALDHQARGDTRVVCQADSMARLRRSVHSARREGYFIRPTDHRALSKRAARRLLAINRKLAKRCRFQSIQTAVTASGNNDRVVVMPGLYTEPRSRAAKTNDPACDKYETTSDSGNPNALSHAYQLHCPNDANLVAVIGRGEPTAPPPSPAREDRHGIPNVGQCIRCNFQLEGSGVSADDVVIEAGDVAAGDGGPSAAGHKKDVGIFADQADGLVLRNLKVRHAREHGIYILESDGYLFDRFKAYYNGAYAVLTFVEDHGRMQNCDAMGSGDSGLYPGAGAKTSAGRNTQYYPDFRYSQELRRCDSHHNDGGYSGTNGNAVWVHHNNFYDNALGFTTDVFTAPGHPGFPQQGALLEDNNFYDNNFNPFVEGSDVTPYIPAPVGTGMWIAGGNDNIVRHNRFYDNYRRGAMLFAVPDSTVCGPPPVGSSTPVPGCDPAKTSTSYNNQFYGNIMGIAPDGSVRPNGTDFWWDSYPANTGNCWWDNQAAPGSSVTSSPSPLPECAGGKDPGSSVGTGSPTNEGELVGCLAGFSVSGYPNGNSTSCTWTQTPAKPGGSRSRATGPRLPVLALSANPAVPAAFAAPAPRLPKSLGLYTCRDWSRAGTGVRTDLLAALRAWVGGPVEGDRLIGYGSVLEDGFARAFFDLRCAAPYAGGFALYKQYGQAAGFAGA
jgi:hypothetical protein